MKAVILAGGMGTRISEETALRPKPMIEIGGRPKSWVAYNRPILTGGGINSFDPIGASIGNSFGVLRGERDASIWARMYEHAASTLRATGLGKP